GSGIDLVPPSPQFGDHGLPQHPPSSGDQRTHVELCCWPCSARPLHHNHVGAPLAGARRVQRPPPIPAGRPQGPPLQPTHQHHPIHRSTSRHPPTTAPLTPPAGRTAGH